MGFKALFKKIEDYYFGIDTYALSVKSSEESGCGNSEAEKIYNVRGFSKLKKFLLYPTTLMDNNFLSILVAVATGLSINILTNLLNFNNTNNWMEFLWLFFQFALAVVFNISLIKLTIKCSTFKDFTEIDYKLAKDDALKKYKMELLDKYNQRYKGIAADFILSVVTLVFILVVIIIIPVVVAVVNIIRGGIS